MNGGIAPHRYARHIDVAHTVSDDSLGMDLGGLRAVVAQAEGMPDSSTVYVSKIHSNDARPGHYWVREIRIEHDTPAPSGTPAGEDGGR